MSILCFGEILWDLFEDGAHIGGAAYNVAAHTAKLGSASYFYSRLGEDALGEKARGEIQRHGVKTEFLQTDPLHPTGTAGVVLDRDAVPTFTIANHTAYDFIRAEKADIERINRMGFDLFYFGTIAQKGEVSRASLSRILNGCRFKEIFFDINIRKPFYSADRIRHSLSYATVLKLNAGELRLLSELFFNRAGEEETVASVFRNYPAIHTVLVTKGPEGATVYSGGKAVSVKHCVSEAVDTVGAGDAFSAGFIVSYLAGADVISAAERGNRLADYVASQKGAIPDYDPKTVLG